MASTIKIKRSGTTTAPTTLASGELAYSWEDSSGGKMYIGWGDETTPGEADYVTPVGGKFYTDKLDHIPGTLTANSALIVDNNSKLQRIIVDNISIDGNSITSMDLDGNITLSPNGSGSVDADGSKIINVVDPTANNDVATKGYVDSIIIDDNVGIAGDGLSLTVNEFSVNVDDSSIEIDSDVLRVKNSGITNDMLAGNIDTSKLANGFINFAANTGSDSVFLEQTVTLSGLNGLTTSVSANNEVSISGVNATNSTTGVASFSSTNFSVSLDGEVTITDIDGGTY